MKFDYDIKYYDFFLLFLMIGLNICGILIVRSASDMDAAVVSRQIMGSLVGVCACIVVSFIDYRKLIKYSVLIFAVSISFLVAVKLLGIVHKGAGRWINLPFLGQVQPSEFCKVGIIIFF
ncbi:MAG: FtsW/RodA/SpoVE family cell cycle protein, partial [Candidatus Avilachnospira sp.]